MATDIVAKAKRNLLSERYGKFDLIEKIFPIEILLNEKPRQLKMQICEKLTVCPVDINYQTFCSWLRRFRSRHLKSISISLSTAENKEVQEKKDWRNFQPSEPSKQPLLQESLLKIINYK